MNIQTLSKKALQKVSGKFRPLFDYLLTELKFAVSDEAILVYQMAKVGSSTLYRTLEQTFFWKPTFHVHFLSEKRLDILEAMYGEKHRFVTLGKYLNFKINGSAVRKWKIVTLVRDPIAREISLFFQTMDRRYPEEVVGGKIKDIDRVVEILQHKISAFDESSSKACLWFDRELKHNFDIDVFDTDFDQQKGYQIIRTDRTEVLIFRLENLNECSEAALQEFFDCEQSIELISQNIGSQKAYGEQYKIVKSKVVIPKEVCIRIYSSRLMRHFYEDATRERFIDRWSKTESSR